MRSYSKGIKLDVKKNAILRYNLFFRKNEKRRKRRSRKKFVFIS